MNKERIQSKRFSKVSRDCFVQKLAFSERKELYYYYIYKII